MKKRLALFFFLSSFLCSAAQGQEGMQRKIGFLFGELPLSSVSELWIYQLTLQKERFTDTSLNLQNTKVFVIKDLSVYKTAIPQIHHALISVSETTITREQAPAPDTINAIHIRIDLKAATTKKEAQEAYSNISSILKNTFTYESRSFYQKSGEPYLSYSNIKYDVLAPVISSMKKHKETGFYTISLFYQKLKKTVKQD
jgi:hypothetical protein